jgi:hypothetical protein
MIGKTLRPLIVLGALLATMPASAQPEVFVENFDSRTLETEAIFQEPTFSGSTYPAHILLTPSSSAVSADRAFSGAQSYKVNWQYNATSTNPWLRLTTSGFNPIMPVTNGYIEFTFFLEGTASLYVTPGVRESNATGALGANAGSSANGIEWIGSANGGSAPRGKTLTPGSWQTIGFLVDMETVNAFAGSTANGILDTTSGKATLESLAFTPVDINQRGPYTLYIDDVFMTFNVKTLTGTILLEDCPTPLVTSLEFRPTAGGPALVRNVLPDANGAINVKVPAGTYNVGVRHGKFLRKVVLNVDLSTADAVLPSMTLTGGDATGDNSVDVLDLDQLIQTFDKCQGDEGFIAGADFNCDDCADVLDLDILIRNFDKQGDEFP